MKAFLLFAAALLAAPAPQPKAASRREQLNGLVAELQKAPSDDGLRRRIIALARTIKPAPAMPDEAKRRMARGGAAVKGAKDPSDWRLAADEFAAASLSAPWSGDVYYNLGLSQDKATDFDAALRSLALAELASPGSEDVKTLRYEVEFRKERSPEARARKDEAFVRSLDGAVYETPWTDGLGVYIKIVGSELVHQQQRRQARVCICGEDHRCGGPLYEVGECGRVRLKGRTAEEKWNSSGGRYSISDDGETITKKSYWLSKWEDVDAPMNTEVYKRKR